MAHTNLAPLQFVIAGTINRLLVEREHAESQVIVNQINVTIARLSELERVMFPLPPIQAEPLADREKHHET